MLVPGTRTVPSVIFNSKTSTVTLYLYCGALNNLNRDVLGSGFAAKLLPTETCTDILSMIVRFRSVGWYPGAVPVLVLERFGLGMYGYQLWVVFE